MTSSYGSNSQLSKVHTDLVIEWVLTEADAKNLARGHKVEKHHPESKYKMHFPYKEETVMVQNIRIYRLY